MSRVVNYRSDTFTVPTPAMRQAMAAAEVGDDVYGEDPTINRLEERMAKLFGKQKALFLPSGTMSNLVAVLAWCQRRGSEVILGNKSHIYLYEQGGISQFGGVAMNVLPNNQDGTIDLHLIKSAIKEDDFHYTTTELIALENTQNECGGRVLPPSYIIEVGNLCKKHNIPLHLDGARIWNAATTSQISLANLVEPVDSISACLSKGLGAPAGSVLLGPEAMIERARRLRKALGGGMRQIGILAAAGLQALDDFESGMLIADHKRARTLGDALSKIPGLQVEIIESNIILINITSEKYVSSAALVERLKELGILTLTHGEKTIRIVVHRDISDDDVDYTINVCATL